MTDDRERSSDDEATVVADDQMIDEIRRAVVEDGRTGVSPASAYALPTSEDGDDDATVVADEGLLRSIRMASQADGAAVRGETPAPNLPHDATVEAGEDADRHTRTGTDPSLTTPVVSGDENPQPPTEYAGGIQSSVDQIAASSKQKADEALDELRQRFAPSEQPSRSAAVPAWLVFSIAGLLVLLVVAVLAVLMVG